MKKITAILLTLLMIVTFSLAGCAGFAIDPVKYYNEVVAKVGDVNITRQQLISAYSSYGNSYFVQQDGQNETSAMNSTLDLLIERELLYQYGYSSKATYKPNAYQVNELLQSMFDSINSQLDDYVNTAKKMLGVESLETETENEDTETAYPLENYYYNYEGSEGEFSKRRAEIVETRTYYTDNSKTTPTEDVTDYYDITYKLVYTYVEPSTVEDIRQEGKKLVLGEANVEYIEDYETNGMLDVVISKYFEQFKDSLTNKFEAQDVENVYNKVKSLLADDLMNYERYLRDANGKAYDKNTDNLIYRYFERIFNDQIKSQYLTNIRTEFLKTENLDLEKLTTRFKYLLRINNEKYTFNKESYKDDMREITTNGDEILYHPSFENENLKYGYFIHTLINVDFTEAQQTEIDSKKVSELGDDIIDSIKNTKVAERDYVTGKTLKSDVQNENGEYENLTKSFEEVIAEYNTIYNMPHETAIQKQARLEEFVKFMFKYTGDNTSTLVPGMPYVIGYDYDWDTADEDEEINYQTYTNMASNFTLEAGKLMKDNEVGKMSSANSEDILTLCITRYGVHLLYYVGDVSAWDVDPNADVYIALENKANGVNLYNKVLNPLTNETYFDFLFDEVYPAVSSTETYTSNNGYSDFEDSLLDQSKVTKYTSKINGTKASI